MIQTSKTPWSQRATVPTVGTPIPGKCVGYIRSIQNIDPPFSYGGANYTVGLSYTMDIDTPNGPLYGVVGVTPSSPRWPYPWLVVPLAVTGTDASGNPYPVYNCAVQNGRVYLLISEERYADLCE